MKCDLDVRRRPALWFPDSLFFSSNLFDKPTENPAEDRERAPRGNWFADKDTVLSFLLLNPFYSQHTFAYYLLQNICFISTCSYLALCACVWTAVMLHLAGSTGDKAKSEKLSALFLLWQSTNCLAIIKVVSMVQTAHWCFTRVMIALIWYYCWHRHMRGKKRNLHTG